MKAYEDNAGGLIVVDEGNRIIGWGAEFCLAALDENNDLRACLTSDLRDWSNWADDKGNSRGDRDETGRELTYDDYIQDIDRPGTKCIAEVISGEVVLYPDRMGNNGRRWSRMDTLKANVSKAGKARAGKPAAVAASRENGKKGGRPRKEEGK